MHNIYQSKNSLDDPKVETIAEFVRRRIGGALGIVSTAYIANATPGELGPQHFRYLSLISRYYYSCSLCSYSGYATVVTEYLNNATSINATFAWPTSCEGPDVIFGCVSVFIHIELVIS